MGRATKATCFSVVVSAFAVVITLYCLSTTKFELGNQPVSFYDQLSLDTGSQTECPPMRQRRSSWYGTSAYPIATENDLWNWILEFVSSPEITATSKQSFARRIIAEVDLTNRSSRESRRTALARFSGTEESAIVSTVLGGLVVDITKQLTTTEISRQFCNATACRTTDLLPVKLSADVLFIQAMTDDLYDTLQLLNCEREAEILVLSMQTERGPTDNERYGALLYDFLNVLYFEYDWVPFASDLSNCREIHYGCTFWTAWKKYRRGDSFEYFPPAGNGNVMYEIHRLGSHLQNPKAGACYRMEPIGATYDGNIYIPRTDGQYTICMDRLKDLSPSTCLVYSFGIGHIWNFEDAMHRLGCSVFSFDPSMNVDTHKRGEHHYFYNMGLVSNYSWVPIQWNVSTVDNIYRDFGHDGRKISVLKMDCETPELNFIESSGFDEIAPFIEQFAMEVHYLPPLKGGRSPENMVRTISKVLHKLEKLGFELFYSRAGKNIPGYIDFRNYDNRVTVFNGSQVIVFELSYYKRRSP